MSFFKKFHKLKKAQNSKQKEYIQSMIFPLAPKKFKLFIAPYKLKLKNKPQSFLEGALLAFDFPSHLRGYSDFLPWPSLGEDNLSTALKNIQKGHFNRRFFIAKQNAFLDARARKEKRNLFFGLKIPPSHFLIPDLLNFIPEKSFIKKNFSLVKVKLKPYKIPEQTEQLKKLSQELEDIKWRLDLNGTSWFLFRDKLKFLNDRLDFIEDPLVEKNLFQLKEKNYFAGDWLFHPQFKIKIVKPSRDRLDSLIKKMGFSHWKRIIFTHSFDHPLGQALSAFWAGIFYKNYYCFFETGAFLTNPLEKTKAYPFYHKGSGFAPPQGFGFGWTDSLKQENWKRWL